MLNTIHRISLSFKGISLFNLYFIVGRRSNQHLYPNLGVRPPCRLHRQPINSPAELRGWKMLPPHVVWVTEASIAQNGSQTSTTRMHCCDIAVVKTLLRGRVGAPAHIAVEMWFPSEEVDSLVYLCSVPVLLNTSVSE